MTNEEIRQRVEKIIDNYAQSSAFKQTFRKEAIELMTKCATMLQSEHEKDLAALKEKYGEVVKALENIIDAYSQTTIPTFNMTVAINKCKTALSNLKDSKEPLFITEDGVKVFENDEFWTVYDDKNKTNIVPTIAHKRFINIHDKLKHFSTEQAAQEYVDSEQSSPTTPDIRKALEDIVKLYKKHKNQNVFDKEEWDKIYDKWGLLINHAESVLIATPDSWISVKDKLPIDGDCILVYLKSPSNTGAYDVVTYLKRGLGEGFYGHAASYKVTHWMPLPDKPTIK